MKQTFISAVCIMLLAVAPMAAHAQTLTPAERAQKLQLIQLLLQQVQLLQLQLAAMQGDASPSSVQADGLEIDFGTTYSMKGWGGQGFFDGESFLVQEVIIQNVSDTAVTFDAADLRLRDSDGTIFSVIHESSVKNQPRFQDTIESLPTSFPDTRTITIYPDEEVQIAVTFYINQVPADDTYNIRYKGGANVPLYVQ